VCLSHFQPNLAFKVQQEPANEEHYTASWLLSSQISNEADYYCHTKTLQLILLENSSLVISAVGVVIWYE